MLSNRSIKFFTNLLDLIPQIFFVLVSNACLACEISLNVSLV